MEQRQQRFSIGYFLVTLFVILLFQHFFMTPHVQTLDYSEFKALLRAGNISRVTLGSEYIQGQLIVPNCSMSPTFLKLLKRGHENASQGSLADPPLASICA